MQPIKDIILGYEFEDDADWVIETLKKQKVKGINVAGSPLNMCTYVYDPNSRTLTVFRDTKEPKTYSHVVMS